MGAHVRGRTACEHAAAGPVAELVPRVVEALELGFAEPVEQPPARGLAGGNGAAARERRVGPLEHARVGAGADPLQGVGRFVREVAGRVQVELVKRCAGPDVTAPMRR